MNTEAITYRRPTGLFGAYQRVDVTRQGDYWRVHAVLDPVFNGTVAGEVEDREWSVRAASPEAAVRTVVRTLRAKREPYRDLLIASIGGNVR